MKIPGLRTRTSSRVAVVTAVTTAVLALPAVTAVAAADTPADWADSPHVSPLQFLLVLLFIPAGLALVISLLVALPSFIHASRDDDGTAWRGEGEWFGGPSQGVGAADEVESDHAADSGAGGASGRW